MAYYVYSESWRIVVGLNFAMALWGLYTGLFLTLMYFSRKNKSRDGPSPFLQILSIGCYVATTAGIVIYLYLTISIILDPPIFQTRAYQSASLLLYWFRFTISLAADIIQIWRCYLVWGKSWAILGSLSIPLVLGQGTGLIHLICSSIILGEASFSSPNENIFHSGILSERSQTILRIIWDSISTFTNSTAALMIVWRIWSHAREMKMTCGFSNPHARYYSRLTSLLVESGLFFTVFEIASFCESFIKHVPSASENSSIPVQVSTHGVTRSAQFVLVGMYPTTLTALAVFGKHIFQEDDFVTSQSLQETTFVDLRTGSNSSTGNDESRKRRPHMPENSSSTLGKVIDITDAPHTEAATRHSESSNV